MTAGIEDAKTMLAKALNATARDDASLAVLFSDGAEPNHIGINGTFDIDQLAETLVDWCGDRCGMLVLKLLHAVAEEFEKPFEEIAPRVMARMDGELKAQPKTSVRTEGNVIYLNDPKGGDR